MSLHLVTVPGVATLCTEGLVGHWRKTTIEYIGPRDEHLVLDPDGKAGNWQVTASSRSEVTTGQWDIDGRILNISLGERTISLPFTMYQGQLVFPNIAGRRGFWERIE